MQIYIYSLKTIQLHQPIRKCQSAEISVSVYLDVFLQDYSVSTWSIYWTDFQNAMLGTVAPSALAESVYLKVIPCSCGATMLFIQEAGTLDSFTVSLHSPNGRQLPAVRAVQGDCQQILKNVWNPHQSYTPIIDRMYRVPQLTFTSGNHTSCKTAMSHIPLSHWQSYCHPARTVNQSRGTQKQCWQNHLDASQRHSMLGSGLLAA